MSKITEKLELVRENIAQAAERAGRSAEDVQLVVVTKNHPVKVIAELYELGVRDVGENRLEEAFFKQEVTGDLKDLRWHMIGHVQSRKAKEVCGPFALFHALDRLKLANRLERSAAEMGIKLPVLLQFNVSGEETKSGWDASHPDLWPALQPQIASVVSCDYLSVRGLMTMAPYSNNPEDARPYFARLRALRDQLAAWFPQADWSQLSMGMSGDYQVAVEEGATLVRIGTAILGEREY